MKIFLAGTLLIAALFPSIVGAAPLQISNTVQVDVLESVPTRDLWNTAKPDVVEASSVILDFRLFDSEAMPRAGNWYGCAIVMIGTTDLAIKPVAVRLWTTDSCGAVVAVAASPTPQFAAEFDFRLNAAETLRIQVTKHLEVSMNGTVIGRIED